MQKRQAFLKVLVEHVENDYRVVIAKRADNETLFIRGSDVQEGDVIFKKIGVFFDNSVKTRYVRFHVLDLIQNLSNDERLWRMLNLVSGDQKEFTIKSNEWIRVPFCNVSYVIWPSTDEVGVFDKIQF